MTTYGSSDTGKISSSSESNFTPVPRYISCSRVWIRLASWLSTDCTPACFQPITVLPPSFGSSIKKGIDQRKVVLDSRTIEDEIMALIDLARLADHCEIYGLEEDLSAKIKQILLESIQERGNPDGISTILRASHFSAASQLPFGHPVRRVMAAAAVPAFIRCEPFYLCSEVTSTPSLALDLLEQLQPILRNCRSNTSYEDPLTEAELDFPDQSQDYSSNPDWPEGRADEV